jgi:hypothetical protein
MTPTTPVPISEWICGESPDQSELYVVHTTAPRFIAAFSEMDDGSVAVHEVVEIDSIPAADAARIRLYATEALQTSLPSEPPSVGS